MKGLSLKTKHDTETSSYWAVTPQAENEGVTEVKYCSWYILYKEFWYILDILLFQMIIYML